MSEQPIGPNTCPYCDGDYGTHAPNCRSASVQAAPMRPAEKLTDPATPLPEKLLIAADTLEKSGEGSTLFVEMLTAAADRLKELEAVVGRLKKTRDGVYIVPPMRVWSNTEPPSFTDIDAVDGRGMGVRFGKTCFEVACGVWANSCYSTEASALASLSQAKDGGTL